MNGGTWGRVARTLADGDNYRVMAAMSLAVATAVGVFFLMISSLGVLFLIGRISESPTADDIVLLGLILGLGAFPLAGWVAYGFRKFILAFGLSLYPNVAAGLVIFNAAA